MAIGRLRRGELLALVGLLALVASLFLDWFDGRGFSALGRPWEDLVVLFALAIVVVLALAQRAAPGRPTFGAVVSLVLAGTLGLLTLLATVVRTLLAAPGGLDPAAGGWLGLAGLLVALAGLWVAVADERRGAPESAFDPPPPRPVPPLRPD
ncbi:hypothetical protein [Patulibacter defluvii]|uniref:hypothetical protein n=1 Tax=Patulibacter defluvii TaxID=3095358 RepID=UPI002A75E094|nr:hypothetical protein [Patulibacter sp. DM4]